MTHKHLLREIAKFASGLVFADFIVGLWLRGANLPPVTFLWTVWTPSAVAWWTVFDIVLFLVLVHYGWKAEIHNPHIGHKAYFRIVGTVTGAVAVVHLVRLVTGFDLEVANQGIPLWFSFAGVLVAGFVSYASFRFAKTSRD